MSSRKATRVLLLSPSLPYHVKLLQDRSEAHALGTRGRALVERLYGWDRSIGELETFHRSMFARNELATAATLP